MEIPPGSVVDFSRADPSIRGVLEHMSISGSCLIVGAPSSKANTIYSNILIEADDTDIIEFDSVVFTTQSTAQIREWWSVDCVSGHIVFRSCTFTHNTRAVSVLCNSTARVTFEGCHFAHINECAVFAGGGIVEMLNCTFTDMPGIGIVLQESGHASLHHSTFNNCTGGMIVPCRGQAVVYDCEFNEILDFCILASNGASVFTKACHSVHCTNAVVVEGGGQTTVSVRGWVVQGANVAMRIGNGSVDVKMHENTFDNCQITTYVAVDTIGKVDIIERRQSACVNESGDKCTFTNGGVVEWYPDKEVKYVQKIA